MCGVGFTSPQPMKSRIDVVLANHCVTRAAHCLWHHGHVLEYIILVFLQGLTGVLSASAGGVLFFRRESNGRCALLPCGVLSKFHMTSSCEQTMSKLLSHMAETEGGRSAESHLSSAAGVEMFGDGTIIAAS